MGDTTDNNEEKSLDVESITIGKLLSSIKRLTVSSIAFLVGLLMAVSFSVYNFVLVKYDEKVEQCVSELEESKKVKTVFTHAFGERFVERELLQTLLPSVKKLQADGVETDGEALASLLWQLKAHDGYAEFLTGDMYNSVRVSADEESFNFEWDSGASVVTDTLVRLGYDPTIDRVAQLNAELNLLGVAWVDDSYYFVRALDGGLSVYGNE